MSSDLILFTKERKQQIIEYVNKNKKATVIELSEYFKVSIPTIRNDLRDLENLGHVTRTHGGVIKKSKSSLEVELNQRTENIKAKKNMAHRALDFIEDGDTIILDSGTTIHELAKILHIKRNLTIITNDITCASIVEPFGFSTLVLGGILQNGFHWTTGSYTNETLRHLSADKAFLSAGGFSIEKGISVGTIPLAEIKQTMIKCAAQNILLCDNSKFEKYRIAKYADFTEINIFITDSIKSDVKNIIEEMGVDIILTEQ